MTSTPHHAFRRFGLGKPAGQFMSADTRQWLLLEMGMQDSRLGQPGPTTWNGISVGVGFRQAENAGRQLRYGMSDLFDDEMSSALNHAATTDLPFRERLVWFWANHFTVSARAGGYTFGLMGAYLQEAIRPHVTGRLPDMLKAVMRHTAMLWYLDNWLSVGPNSPAGLKQKRGINENLARECLELHTLGVHGGYTQQDVTAFAAILTGRGMNESGETPGYVFRADMHEPGPKTFMGRTYPEGFEASEAALDWIAAHPATHRHIATQMVQHFVADVPPPACVARVAAVLADTGGDLKQAALAIADMPEAWQPLTKFRAPAEYVVAVLRALDLPPEPGHRILDATRDLGQPFMSPLLPNGWPDTAADWISGEALLKRADWAMTQASRPGAPTADAVIEATIADVISASTLKAVRSASTPAEALATVFASPEFMRR